MAGQKLTARSPNSHAARRRENERCGERGEQRAPVHSCICLSKNSQISAGPLTSFGVGPRILGARL